MESRLYFHVVAGKQTVHSLIDVYYPELDERKRETLAKSIVAINDHTNNVPYFNHDAPLNHGTWVILPYLEIGCPLFNHLNDPSVTNEFSSCMTRVLYADNVCEIDDETRDTIHHALDHIGPINSIASTHVISHFLEGVSGQLQDDPIKDTVMETAKYIIEHSSESLSELNAAVINFEKALKTYKNAVGKDQRQAAKKTVQMAHEEMSKILSKSVKKIIKIMAEDGEISFLKIKRGAKSFKALNNAGNPMHSAREATAAVITEGQYTKFIKYMKYAKPVVGKALVVFDIGLAIDDVRDAYNEGKDWKEVALVNTIGIVFGMGGGVVGGAVGGFVGILGGPVGIATGTGVGTIGGAIVLEKVGKETTKVFYEFLFNDHN